MPETSSSNLPSEIDLDPYASPRSELVARASPSESEEDDLFSSPPFIAIFRDEDAKGYAPPLPPEECLFLLYEYNAAKLEPGQSLRHRSCTFYSCHDTFVEALEAYQKNTIPYMVLVAISADRFVDIWHDRFPGYIEIARHFHQSVRMLTPSRDKNAPLSAYGEYTRKECSARDERNGITGTEPAVPLLLDWYTASPDASSQNYCDVIRPYRSDIDVDDSTGSDPDAPTDHWSYDTPKPRTQDPILPADADSDDDVLEEFWKTANTRKSQPPSYFA